LGVYLTLTDCTGASSVIGVQMKRFTLTVSAVAVAAMTVVGAPPHVLADELPVVHTDFDRHDFPNGSEVDNRFLPLPPGYQVTLEGTVNGGASQHRVVFTVTDLAKKVDGVRSRVVYDVDSTDGVITEAELAFMAQDDDGNVWNTGEYPEVFEDGKFVGAPAAWLGGVQDALPGVGMRAHPRPGTSQYYQGLVPSIEFGDIASIVGFVPKLCVPAGCFRNVLQIKETNTFASGEGFQMKFYAPWAGNIRIDFVSGGSETESLTATKVVRLSRKALDQARQAALRLDRRAYRVAPDVFAGIPKAVVSNED
jgi:hypothetical protein